ncbi:MAG: AAA family ATPase [Clostridia bacterium]|nr:AAA family ATPase [Clostridia bacterium]
MIYLSEFTFPDADREFDFRLSVKRTCYDTVYPFHVFSGKGLERIEFAPVTILYGGNGSGKTTALNVIGEKLGLQRDTLYNRSNFFEDYTKLCRFETRAPIPENSRVITSDDVFDFMLNLRSLNGGIDRRREELFEDYIENKNERDFRLRSLEDYDQLRKINLARSRTQSRYVRALLKDNVREQSNGESAFYYFTQKIGEGGLYLLDEPENSLSPGRQQELAAFMEDSARFFRCQFVIATHSPFVLALREAKIYDLDGDPAAVRRWTELPAVRAYYEFFKKHERELENDRV